jgi:LysM repeat protein
MGVHGLMEAQSDGAARTSCPFADVRPEGCICIALADNKRISADYQSRFCFTDQHVRCRRFQRAVPEIPDPVAATAGPWIDDPRVVAAVAVLSVIMFLAIIATAFHGTWSGWFSDNGSSTPTTESAIGNSSSPTAIVVGGSAQGSTIRGTASANATEIPILQASPTTTAATPAATPATGTSTITPTTGSATTTATSTAGTATSTVTPTAENPTPSTARTSNPASTETPASPVVTSPQTTFPVTSSIPASPTVYTVQPGETLFSIGQTYGIPTELLAAANNLANADLIMPGDQLFIPSPDGHLPPEAPLAGVHIVAPGDAMSTIASTFGVTVQTLMDFNNISDADVIHVGTIIKIPKTTSTVSAPGTGILTTDVVQTGDTLYSISQRFGVSVDAIMAANNLSDRNTVSVGQVLLIPRV